MAVLYRIRDWNEHFENNRTRELKRMEWVPIPNQMDGDGYTELLDHPDGAAHFGAWIALVEVASRCVPRGDLSRTIPHPGAATPQEGADDPRTLLRPHDSSSLSRMTRIPAEVFDEAIPRLVSIGWLASELVISSIDTTIPQEGAELAALSRTRVRDSDYGMERNGTERKKAPNGALAASAAAADLPEADSAMPRTNPRADAGKTGGRKTAARKPKPKADPRPEHGEVRAYFCERWKARFGADYAWKHGRDDAHAKWILDQCGRDPAEAKRIVKAFIGDDDKWLADRGHDIALLVSRFNSYRAKRPAAVDDPDDPRRSPGFVPRYPTPAEACALLGFPPSAARDAETSEPIEPVGPDNPENANGQHVEPAA